MAQILDEILSRLVLLDKDREALLAKRGLSDVACRRYGLVSANKENERVILNVAALREEECVSHGLVMRSGDKLRVWSKLIDDNIIIPYWDNDGSCSLLRPHKFNPKDIPLQVYFTRGHYTEGKVTVLAEGEFKAMAAEEFGYQALAIPGISSFVSTKIADGANKSRFAEFCELLSARNIKHVCIVFDNENKSDVTLPGYKPESDKRYDPQIYAYRMAKQLEEAGFSATVGWIPDSWRDSRGKADIDGMLASGATKLDFANVVDSALPADLFVESRTGEEKEVLLRKLKLKSKPVVQQAGSGVSLVAKNGVYVWMMPDGTERPVSNFTMEYLCTYLDDAGVLTHEFTLTSIEGQRNTCILDGKELSDRKKFRGAIMSRGKFIWGADKDFMLDALGVLVLPSELKVTHLVSCIGWSEEEKCYFFDNCTVLGDGSQLQYGDDGIVIVNNKRFKLSKQADRPRISFNFSGIGNLDMIREVHERLRRNFRSKSGQESYGVTLAYAWFLASALKPWLFPINRTFPILFVFGSKGSGKTRLLQWLMNVFFSERTDTIVGQNSPAFIRNRAAQLSHLPFWLEEFRNDAESQRHLSILRGMYDHSSAGVSANSHGGNRVYNLKAALVVSGESEPADETGALNQRILLAEIHPDISGSEFSWLEQNQYTFGSMFTYLVKNHDRYIGAIQHKYEQNVETYRKDKTLSARAGVNYALIHAVMQVILGVEPESVGADNQIREVKIDEAEGDPVLDMIQTCIESYNDRDSTIRQYIAVKEFWQDGTKPIIAFNLRKCYSFYSKIARSLGRTVAPARSIRKILQQKKWIVQDTQVIRVGSTVFRATIILLELAAPELVTGAYSIATTPRLRKLLRDTFGNEQGPLADIVHGNMAKDNPEDLD